MWVLSRKPSEPILIGEQITVTVVRISGGKVRLGIDAPKDVPIERPDMKKGPPPLKAA